MIIEKQTHPEFKVGVNADVDQVAEQLTNLAFRAYMFVRVQAATGNLGNIYVGHNAGVTSANGWALDAGEHVDIPIDDPTKIWVIADADNQAVKWFVV